MATTSDVVLTRIESMEAELRRLKELVVNPPATASRRASVQTTRGIEPGAAFSDDEIEEITHPQRRIDALKVENAALRAELERYRNEETSR